MHMIIEDTDKLALTEAGRVSCSILGDVSCCRAALSVMLGSVLFFVAPVAGQVLPSPQEHTLLFYNVENLFHPSDDSIPGDDDFTPAGIRHWTWNRYRKKVSMIAKVIHAAGGWEPPDMVGMCEIENEKVLKDLIFHPVLVNYGYRIVHRNSPDHRGIDVALLYRDERITLLESAFIPVRLNGAVRPTREILAATIGLPQDTCIVYINHWTSKYGGEMETEHLRRTQAGILRKYADSLHAANPCYPQIIAGDFNEPSGSVPLRELTSGGRIREILPRGRAASYKYRGRWESIDHLFIMQPGGDSIPSSHMLECRAEIFSPPWLMEEDEKYAGNKPYRTYYGYNYSGGFSDHLPLLLRFRVKVEKAP